MSASLNTIRTSFKGQPPARLEFARRLALAMLALLLCYQFEWQWLRSLTAGLNIQLDALFDVELRRLSSDTVTLGGGVLRYENACTFVDVWCAAIPLLWDAGQTAWQNLRFLLVISIAMLALNIVRLSITDVLFGHGVAWVWAEGVIGGLAYWAVWSVIVHRRAWAGTAPSDL
jgi:hypothetical protein